MEAAIPVGPAAATASQATAAVLAATATQGAESACYASY